MEAEAVHHGVDGYLITLDANGSFASKKPVSNLEQLKEANTHIMGEIVTPVAPLASGIIWPVAPERVYLTDGVRN